MDGFDNAGLSRVIIRGFTVQNADHQGILVTNASDVSIVENHVTGNDRAIQLNPNGAPTCPGLPAYLAAFQGMDCGEGIQLSGVTNSTVADNVVTATQAVPGERRHCAEPRQLHHEQCGS